MAGARAQPTTPPSARPATTPHLLGRKPAELHKDLTERDDRALSGAYVLGALDGMGEPA